MPRFILMEEFHLTARAPHDLPESEFVAIRRTLDDARFQAGLRRAVREVFRQQPDLSKVRVTLSR